MTTSPSDEEIFDLCPNCGYESWDGDWCYECGYPHDLDSIEEENDD